MMRVLVLNFNIRGVGTYQRSFYFSRELARHGHEVTMVTVSRDSLLRPNVYYKRDWAGLSVERNGTGPWVRMIEGPNLGYKWLPGWGSGPLDIWLRIREIIGGNYDVIYGFEYHPNVSWPVYLTRFFKSYHFYSDWCDWFAGNSNQFRGIKIAHKIDRYLEERIRFLARKVTVISKTLHKRALSIGIAADRVRLIPQGVDTEYVRPMSMERSRATIGIPHEDLVLLTGSDDGTTLAIDVFATVLRVVPSARLVVLGREQISAQRRVEELGIADKVYFTGWVSDEDYIRYVACANVCFLPLKDCTLNQARWPAKILDYLAAGRPVVTNGVGDVRDLFTQHRVGLLAPHDIQSMAEVIAELLRDKEQQHFLGVKARQLMEDEWDWQIRGKQIAKIIEETSIMK